MKPVSISELKARLSHYIRRVQKGGEVEIVHRGVPVARLVGVRGSGEEDDARRRQRLVALGLLRAGTGDASFILDREPVELDGVDLSAALHEVREDRV